MAIVGIGSTTYLYVNGLSCNHEINLQDNIVLKPANSKMQFNKASKLIKSDIDRSIAVLSSVTLSTELKITATDEQELAINAWNAQWDCLLLGALFNCDVMSNLQCDKPIDEIENASYINITNYAFHALLSENYIISEQDESWLHEYYRRASNMLQVNDTYRTAVHAMASYRWHSMPRIQLAILWSGIESLFNVSTEISFRVSIYIARFLAGDNEQEAKQVFKKVRKIYNMCSSDIHGNKIKDNINDSVKESAILLNQIIKKCAEIGTVPDTENLIFNI